MSKYKRRYGDRKEGRLIRSLPGFAKFVPYIMPTRNDAWLNYEESFEVSTLDRRLRKLRVDGYKGIGILHFIIAAYVRAISMLPGVNRFVVGRRIYARDGIEVVMVVKRSISINATETTIKVHFVPTDTIFDVYRKLNEKIEEIKKMLENGELHVYDTATFTVDGQKLDSYMADVDTDPNYEGDTEVIIDGYFHESEFRSAPYFNVQIDGIKLLDQNFGS